MGRGGVSPIEHDTQHASRAGAALTTGLTILWSMWGLMHRSPVTPTLPQPAAESAWPSPAISLWGEKGLFSCTSTQEVCP